MEALESDSPRSSRAAKPALVGSIWHGFWLVLCFFGWSYGFWFLVGLMPELSTLLNSKATLVLAYTEV